MDKQAEREVNFRQIINIQEVTINEQKNVTEAIGWEQNVRDEQRDLDAEIEGVGQEELLDFAGQIVDDPLSCHSELIEHIR